MKTPFFKKKYFLHVNHKILLAFLAAVLLIYSIGLYINLRLQSEVTENFLNSIKSKSNYISVELTSRLEHIDNLITYTITRYNVRKLVLYNSSNSIADMMDELRSVREVLSSITSSSNLVENAAIYLPALEFKISSYNYKEEFDESDYLFLEYLNQLDSIEGFTLWNDKIYMVSTIYSPNDKETEYPAALIIELSNASFYQYASSASLYENSDTLIIVNDKYIIEESVLETTYKNHSAAEIVSTSQSSEDTLEYIETEIDGGKYFCISEKLEDFNITILSVTDSKEITKYINQPQTWSLLFTIIAGFAFVSFLLLVNHLVTRPIKKINDTIEILEHDHILEFNYDKNELTSLYEAFNKLIGRFKGAIEQVYNNKLIAHQAEMKYLQAQINPHFLYNSFFHLYRMSKLEDLDGVAEMSNKLGRYYQYITRSASAVVPFEMEYGNAKDYSDIQTIRFGNRIKTSFAELKDEYKNIEVPRFILQPILENAYNHGLDSVTSGGIIDIHVSSDDENLIVSVKDNGLPVSCSIISELTEYLENSDNTKEITGLKNTKIRLATFGGDLRVESINDGGLKVTIFIPLKARKKE